MLDLSLDSVDSALKRARTSLLCRRPPVADRERPPASGSPSGDAIVADFVDAYESVDLDALVRLLTDDVFCSMPPMPFEYEGRPAFGVHLRAPNGIAHGVGLIVLTLAGDQICAMSRFENAVLPWFGLPRSLPSR
ncbi:MAG: hypothetical protein ABJA34_00535 [Pseudonocardiales bacterium]